MDADRAAAPGSSRRDDLRRIHDRQGPWLAFAAAPGNRRGGDARLRRQRRTSLPLSPRAARLSPQCRSIRRGRLLNALTMELTMSNYQDLYRSRLTSPQLALRDLPKRCSVLLGIFTAQPPALVQALADRAKAGEVDEALVYYMHATPATIEALIRIDLMEVIKLYPFFLGAGERGLVRQLGDHSRKVVHFVPNSFSEIPRIVRERPPFDVFLLQVSPMDRTGWFTFGPNGAYSLAGIERAKG